MTRPKKEETDRLYLHLSSEKAANYVFRKCSIVANNDIKVTPFVLPQLYHRFSDLSKNTYNERKANQNLKTQIRIGEEDSILLVKQKGNKEWE